MFHNSFHEEIPPNVQFEFPLEQLESCNLLSCFLGEEADHHFATSSFQVVVEGDAVLPKPPFLQLKPLQALINAMGHPPFGNAVLSTANCENQHSGQDHNFLAHVVLTKLELFCRFVIIMDE